MMITKTIIRIFIAYRMFVILDDVLFVLFDVLYVVSCINYVNKKCKCGIYVLNLQSQIV